MAPRACAALAGAGPCNTLAVRRSTIGFTVLLFGCGGVVFATTAALDDGGADATVDSAADADDTTVRDASSDGADASETSEADLGDAGPTGWAVAEGLLGVLFRGPSAAVETSGRATFVGHFEPAPAFGFATPCGGTVVVLRVDADGKGVFRRCFSELYEGNGLAVGADGATYLGTYPVSSAGVSAARARKLDAAGDTVWEKTYSPGTFTNGTMTRTLGLAGSEVLLGGHTALAVDFGTGLQGGVAVSTGIVARLSAATGATLWVRTLGDCTGCGRTDVLSVAGSKSATYLAGDWFGGPTDLGEGPVTADTGTYLVALDDKGANRWVKRFPLNGPSLAVGPSGELVCAGSTSTGIDFGKGVTVTTGGYVVVFEPEGTPRWARNTGGPASLSVLGSDVWVAGSKDEGGVQGAWLAHLRLKDGAIVSEGWPGRTAATAGQTIHGVAAATSGAVVIGGFRSTIRFGSTILTATPTDGGAFAQTAFFARVFP